MSTLASANPSLYLNHHRCRQHSLFSSSQRLPVILHQYPILANQGSSPFNITIKPIMALGASDNSQPEPRPVPARPSSPAWKKWVVGMLLSIVLPSFRHKWGPLLVLENKVNTTVETVESVTEAVEELAEVVEKVAEEVEDKLPDNTKLKEVMESVENLAKQTVKEAELAQDLIHKVEEMEKDIENKLMEPGMDQAKVVSPKEP